jgi:predicted deacetylase
MLHGYHHDEPDLRLEFSERRSEPELIKRVSYGRKYLEDLIGTAIRVFVPPGNGLSRPGLDAIVRGGLHLGRCSGDARRLERRNLCSNLATWHRLRTLELKMEASGFRGFSIWATIGKSRGNPDKPLLSRLEHNQAIFETGAIREAVSCAATHYWEFLHQE